MGRVCFLPVAEDKVVLPRDQEHGARETRDREGGETDFGGQSLHDGERGLVRFGVLSCGEGVGGGFEEASFHQGHRVSGMFGTGRRGRMER